MRVFLRTLAAMNTRFSLLLPGVDDAAGNALTREIAATLAAYERMMSRFAPDAELARVNRDAAEGAIELSEALCAVLADCREHWRQTAGAFDVTLGAVNDNWRGIAGAPRTGWGNIALDARTRRIRFRLPGVRLDLGAIGKGIALRTIRDMLVARGTRHALLSFGESSIVAIGTRPDGSDWTIGVCDPGDRGTAAHAFHLRDAALSTSGGGAAPHLVDPRTGAATGTNRQLTVACACPVAAEVLSTALIAAPVEARAAILSAYPPARAVEFCWQSKGAGQVSEKVWAHAA